MDHYVQVDGKRLRCGYTTGTCGAAAARGAAELLLNRALPEALLVETPAGILVKTEPVDPSQGDGWACCAVRKDAGDDPDVTDGALVYARVEIWDGAGVLIEGGKGVGRVTKPGLDQPVGQAAINRVPREMIKRQVLEAAQRYGYAGGLKIIISVPEGERLALKTFNPRLGIEGGVSILGTSGIVRPMSRSALVETTRVELSVQRAAGRRDILVSPGNYGERFCGETLGLSTKALVLCSNYIGECIDHAAALGFSSLLLVGHLGKLIKVAGGSMDTHSRASGGRRETLTAHAALCGGEKALLRAIYDCGTTDEAIPFLMGGNLLKPVMESVSAALAESLSYRSGAGLKAEAVFFSNQFGVLGKTAGAEALLALHR